MKYIEELNPGDIFIFENHKFILTQDFKKHKNDYIRMCIKIEDGSPRWLNDSSITEFCELFYRDTDNNFLMLKNHDKKNS